jgi:hypothetical protein
MKRAKAMQTSWTDRTRVINHECGIEKVGVIVDCSELLKERLMAT